ncbi:MAG TPA: hypothetical protein VHK90_13660, partial [Thermoanaerobaculia bacterium]|nr:hypothetical protein [Thermoanaerobaculia bacterium]
MSVVRQVPRGLTLLVVALVVAGCAGQGDSTVPRVPKMQGNPCTSGMGSTNRQAPIVCVDDAVRTLSVMPDPVTVHDVAESDR